MTTLADRVKRSREKLGLNQKELAKLCNVSQNAISKIESSGTQQPRNLVQIANALKVNIQWLQSGEGEPEQVLDLAIIEKDKDYSDSHIGISLYDIKLSAGNGTAIVEWIPRKSDEPLLFRSAWFKAKRLYPENCKAMYVRGNSMSPVLEDWDTVIVDISDTEIIDGEIYALSYKNNFYIKQVIRAGNNIDLISFNTTYAPIVINEDDLQHLKIIGKKVWRGG